MDFIWNNQARKLQGLGEQSIQEATLKKVSKDCRQQQMLFAVCFLLTIKEKIQNTNYGNKDIQHIIEEHQDVFQESSCLPPVREVTHCIAFKKGTEPVNVQPYKYAHFQKEEIEKQVQEMLKSGHIHTNTSPFSSPMLLV
jgi:tagatose-1,6-bisphosphate aldolase